MRVFVGSHSNLIHLGIASAQSAGQASTTNGSTTHFNVGVLPAVGGAGQTILAAILQRCEGDYDALNRYFGFAGPTFNVTVAALSPGIDGSGGAFHPTCESANLTADACIAPVLRA